ncbi:MAG: Gfo/Idh/MocA family oxidoreductase [Acidobacteria bacterium]|nr:Gfo/Idh/MocA family oxidoreductase [Acidobacteriota bacterium]
MSVKIKVAVIGAGYTANEHLKAFKDMEEVELIGIFSRTKDKAEKLSETYGIKNVCNSIEELWEKTNADLVVITVNELSMPFVIEKSLDFNWEMLVEKPPSIYVEEAERLNALAEKKNKKIKVALNRASYSVTQFVINEIENKEGKRIIIAQDQEDPERALSAGQPKEVVERWMYANSIHIIDYFRIFARGKFAKVATFGDIDYKKPCFLEAHIEFDSGDYGVYQAFWNEPAPWAITVHLPDVRYELRPLEEGKKQVRWQRPEAIPVDEWDLKFKPGFRKQAEEMIKYVKKEKSLIPSFDDAIKTMKLIKEIYKR